MPDEDMNKANDSFDKTEEKKDRTQDAPEKTEAAPPEADCQATSQAEESDEEQPTFAQWKEALEKCVKQRDEYLGMAQRTQAEFSNFRRRNAQVRADAYDDGVREALSQLLPSLDNMDRALEAAAKTQDYLALASGVEMTRNGLIEAMQKMGLEEVPALGTVFDPELHNAVLRGTDGEPGTVTEVFQKGYRVKGRMIRYAMVKVAAE